MNNLSFIIIVMFLFLTGCKKNISPDEMKEIVKLNNDKLGEYFIAGDAGKLTSMYDAHAVIAPNGDDFHTGLETIKNMYLKDTKESKILEMRTETMTVTGTRDIIFETGKTYLKINYNDTILNTHVKYCNIWKLQEDGQYKLAVDIWNKDKTI
jgi:ketosteroid isomerase-like protein